MEQEKQMLKAHLLKNQGYKQREIAEMLEVSDRTIRNYLKNPPAKRKKRIYKSILDSYKPFIKNIIQSNPFYNCVILFERLQQLGFEGRISILRDYVSTIRKNIM